MMNPFETVNSSLEPTYLKQKIDEEISRFSAEYYTLNSKNLDDDTKLHSALRYILEGEGKRVRAILCMMVAQSLGAPLAKAVPPAIALELVHAYSLVHDDLPCMDNDRFRRGRPTAHIQFDEATALLAGDALLADSFLLLCKSQNLFGVDLDAEIILELVRELSFAAGGHGMVLGQALDLYWTGKPLRDVYAIEKIHSLKTGALIGAAAAMGAVVANSNEHTVKTLREFGSRLGLAFQVQDDFLDDKIGIGKTPGKDRSSGKVTFAIALGTTEGQKLASDLTDQALGLLRSVCKDSTKIEQFARSLLNRQY